MNHRWRDVRANPERIVQAHYSSYRHAASGRVTGSVLAELFLLPIATGAAVLWFRIDITAETGGALIAAAGLVGAFLFSAMLGIAARAMEWENERPEPGPRTSSRARLLEELAANSGYAAIVCVAVVIALTIASIEPLADPTGDWIGVSATALGLALGVHLVLTLFMVMKRLFAATQSSLWKVRGGEAAPPRPRARKSNDE